MEVQHVAADVGARVVPLHDVERPGHDTDMDAFLRRAALYVVGVAAEANRYPPNSFDQVKDRLPLLTADDVAEHAAQQANIAAQRRVLVGVHDRPRRLA